MYYYDIKHNADEWWWQPLPQWVTSIISSNTITNIISMSNDKLCDFHNEHLDEPLGKISRALLWVAQGECYRRGFEVACIKCKALD